MVVNRRLVLAGLIGAGAAAKVGSYVITRAGAEVSVAPPTTPSPAPVVAPVAQASPATVAAPVPPPTVPAAPAPAALPPWQRFAVRPPVRADKPIITVVIDDLGVMHRNTERAVALPGGPLTLSWFPFATHPQEQVMAAVARGHEITLHMPMQSHTNSIAWTGPNPLRIDLPQAENLARLRWAMDMIPNSVGLNNHMGSVATKDPALMALVAQETRGRGLLFLDSLVIPHSVAYAEAAAVGVPAASRDVFIDHTENPNDIRFNLELTEQTARRKGHAIAIGHPWPNTLVALEGWLPSLTAKGFVLWPLSATVALRNQITIPSMATT